MPPCLNRLAEAERDLDAVRSQLRQHATRKKHLEDVCAQLDCPTPPPPPLVLPATSDGGGGGPEGGGVSSVDSEWRAQRLEYLMYRWGGGRIQIRNLKAHGLPLTNPCFSYPST